MAQLFNKLALKIAIFAALTTVCFPGVQTEDNLEKLRIKNGDVSEKLLSAMENIIDVQDTIQDQLDTLEEKERLISKEKEQLKLVSKDIQTVFPTTGRRRDRQNKEFYRRLRDLSRKETTLAQEKRLLKAKYLNAKAGDKEVSKKSNGSSVLIGVLVGAIGVGLGIVLWKGIGGRSNNNGKSFEERAWSEKIGGLADYLQEVA